MSVDLDDDDFDDIDLDDDWGMFDGSAARRRLARVELDKVLERIESALSTPVGREMLARAEARYSGSHCADVA